jgi:hypothetical protein
LARRVLADGVLADGVLADGVLAGGFMVRIWSLSTRHDGVSLYAVELVLYGGLLGRMNLGEYPRECLDGEYKRKKGNGWEFDVLIVFILDTRPYEIF